MSSRQFISESHVLTNPFGIYLHIPFCVHKCSYCDFYSFVKYSTDDFQSLTRVIIQEIELSSKWLKSEKGFEKKVSSIFFGGGTPSLLPVRLLVEIFESLQKNFTFSESCEITTEANPETVHPEWVTGIRQNTPINRISLGAQSFDLENLRKLERLCGPERVVEAATLLKQNGFDNFNLDLIMGIPGQNLRDVENDMKKVIELSPKHVSNYSLTLKPGHALYNALPKEDLSADIYESAVSFLEGEGYSQYEISNFSREGFECAHNLLYWTGGDFLGVGPSASGRFFWDGVFQHKKNLSDLNLYLEKSLQSISTYEATTPQQTLLEASFLELRCNRGVDISKFKSRYGFDFRKAQQFEMMKKHSLIEESQGVLKLTSKGRLLADSVTSRLVD